MSAAYGHDRVSPGTAPAAGWTGRPRYAPADIAALLWRERLLIVAVFGVLFVLGAAVAWRMEETYPARSSLLVRLGQEYVYQPMAGEAGSGSAPQITEIIQSEREILTSQQLRTRVVERLGYATLFPDKAARFRRASPERRRSLIAQGADAVGKNLAVETAPEQGVIRLTYTSKNPNRAALVLNTLIDEYLVYRRQVFADETLPEVTRQREAFEARLALANAVYQDFLIQNGIGDFEAERVSLNTLYTTLNDTRFRNQARLSELRGRVGGQSAAMRGLQPEISLYRDVDDTAARKLTALRVQRDELLSRYRPEAGPVRELDRQIDQLEAAVAAGRGVGEQVRRVGVNPVYQTLQTERLQVQAEAASLQQSIDVIDRQLGEIAARRRYLATLEPRYQQLVRERSLLETNVRAFAAREQEGQAAAAVAQSANDNIRVVERAVAPVEGDSLRWPLLAISFIFAVVTALAASLTKIFLGRGFATPASASRALDLPVLTTAPAVRA
ncbi:MAG: lipopolysaccharide biosynthesis protein [Pseudomonadota bacterium]|nr:lipopolysaccharide biosynthesis protein [Pseudomonadota bacterium]